MEGGQGIRSVRRCVTAVRLHFSVAHAAHMRARTHASLVHAAQILTLALPLRCEMFDVRVHVRLRAFMHACVRGCGGQLPCWRRLHHTGETGQRSLAASHASDRSSMIECNKLARALAHTAPGYMRACVHVCFCARVWGQACG